MKNNQPYFDVNKDTWNTKVGIHAKSEFYAMEKFRAGNCSLNSYELNALGDVTGKSLLHLQCHFGQDTLSWSRKGAQCTGVDISEEGIILARELNDELGLDANFVCCNVLDTTTHVGQQYDIVFTSYGVIGWLPDLKPWGQMIAQMLKHGGVFYMIEFHPLVWMFDYSKNTPTIDYPYDSREPIYEEYKGTYADENAEMISKEYGWNHGLGTILTALTDAGLELSSFREYDASPYKIFPDLEETSDGMFMLGNKLYPLLFEIKAIAP